MAGLMEQLKTITDVNEILAMKEREFKAIIGIAPVVFVKLLEVFQESEEELKQKAEAERTSPRQRRAGGGRKRTLRTPASRLGFILHYFKGYDTLDDLADQAGFHRSNASRSIQWLIDVLLLALKKLDVLPAREFASPADLEAAFAGIEELIIDATERPTLRPQDATAQKEAYSGKKHQHSVKNTVISSVRRQILFLGYTVCGSRHDYGLFKSEFPSTTDLPSVTELPSVTNFLSATEFPSATELPSVTNFPSATELPSVTDFPSVSDWFAHFKIWVDLGYLGFAKDYKTLELHIPHKKPRKSKSTPTPSLSDQQKLENREISQVRIVVEHVLASIKHWAILFNKFRNRLDKFADKCIGQRDREI